MALRTPGLPRHSMGLCCWSLSVQSSGKADSRSSVRLLGTIARYCSGFYPEPLKDPKKRNPLILPLFPPCSIGFILRVPFLGSLRGSG